MFAAPYTKVEESFNIQAIHDILSYGYGTPSNTTFLSTQYDHVEFPGAVPRTFVGAAFISALSHPFVQYAQSPIGKQIQGIHSPPALALSDYSISVRTVMGLVNSAALIYYQRQVRKSFGLITSRWYTLLQASQFHVIYYASRTLPNMFAFALSMIVFKSCLVRPLTYTATFALGKVISIPPDHSLAQAETRIRTSLVALTVAGVVFRSELAVLVATQSLYLFAWRNVSLFTIVPAGMIGLLVGLPITVLTDSYFWQQFPTWPEWTSFYYNTVLGKSADWGTSPWYFYFANSMPRLLLNPLAYAVLVPIALISTSSRRISHPILVPQLSFVAIYSLLPHKEWRFIVYIVPGLTTVAAVGANRVWARRAKSVLYGILSIAIIISIAVSFAVSLSLLLISSLNYPGGLAMTRLEEMVRGNNVTVFADNLACQTGVTRFLEGRRKENAAAPLFQLYKTENQTELLDPNFWKQFDYALAEHPERCIGKWEVAGVVTAFNGMKVVRPDQSLGPETIAQQLVAKDLRPEFWQTWNSIGDRLRPKWTRGWWVTIRMEPKIKILKQQSL